MYRKAVLYLDTIDRILQLMDSNGVSASKLTQEAGITNGLVTQWKSRKQQPSAKNLAKIAAYFNVSLDWLAGNEQKNKPSDNFGELSQAEIDLLHAFRKLNDNGQDMILRAAGVDPDSIKPEDKK
jgi:transcriptional regulator with XRE-family HTH domain